MMHRSRSGTAWVAASHAVFYIAFVTMPTSASRVADREEVYVLVPAIYSEGDNRDVVESRPWLGSDQQGNQVYFTGSQPVLRAGQWVHYDTDVKQLIRESRVRGQPRTFVPEEHFLAKLSVGWEVWGGFDTDIEFKNLSLCGWSPASVANAPEATPAACSTASVAIPVADAHYSFGTTATGDGCVLFTEFNRRVIRRWNPLRRQTDVWRAQETPGIFGIAAHAAGDVFVGLDLGDEGNPGKILRIAADGTEEHVIEGITRPRQLACDAAGNLYAAIEGGEVLTWSRSTGTAAELMTATPPVSGVAVGPDGSVYLSEYGRFSHMQEGYSRPEAPGLVKVRRPDGTVSVLADGFWRARGIALHGRHLYLCTEANREDQGNSGLLVRIDTRSGEQETIMQRLDYPQFPATDARGHIFFTLGRDNKLMHVDPAASFRIFDAPCPGVNAAAVRGGRVQWGQPADGISFSLESQRLTIHGDLLPDADATFMDGYFEVPASHFTLNPRPLHDTFDRDHPAPGVFELPAVRAECDSGAISVQVLPLRRHQGQRWPMRNVGARDESPAPGFDEQPEAFRLHFHWEPSERK